MLNPVLTPPEVLEDEDQDGQHGQSRGVVNGVEGGQERAVEMACDVVAGLGSEAILCCVVQKTKFLRFFYRNRVYLDVLFMLLIFLAKVALHIW